MLSPCGKWRREKFLWHRGVQRTGPAISGIPALMASSALGGILVVLVYLLLLEIK